MRDAKTSERIQEFISNAVKWISSYLKVDFNDSESVVSAATALGTDAIMIFANVLVALFLAIYMLICKESYMGHIKRLLYAVLKAERANLGLEIGRKANEIFYGFIIGKIIDSAIIGVICYFSMLIMRMPYPLLCSFVIGVTNVIPVFGPYIGATPTVILIFVTDPPKGIIFLIYILILQQIDGNLIGPKILGDSTGITSFWVIIAVVAGGSLFGFMGMLIGVPTLALILYIVDRFTQIHVKKKQLPERAEDYIDVDHIEGDSGKVVYRERKVDDGRY
jgi:predicted PurR-regulated permease PerM